VVLIELKTGFNHNQNRANLTLRITEIFAYLVAPSCLHKKTHTNVIPQDFTNQIAKKQVLLQLDRSRNAAGGVDAPTATLCPNVIKRRRMVNRSRQRFFDVAQNRFPEVSERRSAVHQDAVSRDSVVLYGYDDAESTRNGMVSPQSDRAHFYTYRSSDW